jgi:acetate kinase
VRLLIVNAGSSSVKLRVLGDDDDLVASADQPIDQSLQGFLASPAAGSVDAAVHRIVHGGADYTAAVRVDDDVELHLDQLTALAPLHNPRGLAGIRAIERLRPDLPQVACFDTAFHASMPAAAATYALPRRWIERWGLRRYGFHGLSHAYASRRFSEIAGRPPGDLKLVTAHLGSGASLAAVDGGRSVDTTMGFTPLEGLVMSTRSGTVDPGLVLWLQRQAGMSADEVERGLEHESGLLGLAGSADLREVIAAADAGDEAAALAYAVMIHRLRASIAAMTAALGRIDGLVFTGGAGEKSERLRADVCRDLVVLGDAQVVVVEAREDLEMARQARELW